MSFIKWIKIQWYLPQLNKAEKMIKYYKMTIDEYSKRTNLRGRALGTLDHARKSLVVWEHKKEQCLIKLESIRHD